MFTLAFLFFLHIFSIIAACHVLLTKRDPRSALGWVSLLLFLPIGGLLIYLIFGISRAHSRAEYIMRRLANISIQLAPPQETPHIDFPGLPEARDMARTGDKLTSMPLCPGNAVTPYHNGDNAYPAMLEAINSAKKHVFLSTYIFNYGYAAQLFIDALTSARNRGVDVRVLVDGVGQLYSWKKPIKILAAKGIKTAVFRPARLFPPNFGINLRSHRKALVCDETGFTGGMNIADGNLLNRHVGKISKIQDMQFKFQGPVVNQLKRAFLLNWSFCVNQLNYPQYMEIPENGPCDCRVIVDGPGDDSDAINDIVCGAINIARKRIRIMTPYFLPTFSVNAALRSAAQRGVDTRVILPAHNNLFYMDWAMWRVMPQLMQGGVRFWYQMPPFAHTKLLAIDDFYCLIGSANIDSRSLLLNFELNVEIYNTDFNTRMVNFMDKAIDLGREIFMLDIESQPFFAKLRNAVCWVFSPYF